MTMQDATVNHLPAHESRPTWRARCGFRVRVFGCVNFFARRRDLGCEFFATTGHLVCGDFMQYWESHGLDFGDPGISFRESLALSGYPISEQFTDPQTGLMTQYFERAVFEYHPDNPSAYKVLLKRLGAAELAARGW